MVYSDLNFFSVQDDHFTPLDPRVELSTFLNSSGEEQVFIVGTFPVNIFICSEADDVQLVTSTKLQATYYNAFLSYPNTKGVHSSLRYDFFSGIYSMTEHTSFETTLVDQSSNHTPFLSNLYSYHSFFSGIRVNLFWYNNAKKPSQSSTSVFYNATWLERESSEMYNTSFLGLVDSRKLLLDYSTPRGVLTKHETDYLYNYYYQNHKYVV